MSRKTARTTLKLGAIFALLAITFSTVGSADPRETPFSLHGHLVVVLGTVEGIPELNCVIDTGATQTVISNQLAKRLKLKTRKVTAVSWGQTVRVSAGHIAEIRIGESQFNDIEVRVGNLAVAEGLRVDALIGLDILKRSNLTFDYENRTLVFGAKQELPRGEFFYGSLPFIPIRMKVQEAPLILVLDTGAAQLILFKEEVEKRIHLQPTRDRVRIGHVAGHLDLRGVLVEEAAMAEQNPETVPAYLADISSKAYGGADGIFSPTWLHLKQLQINFESHRISWEF